MIVTMKKTNIALLGVKICYGIMMLHLYFISSAFGTIIPHCTQIMTVACMLIIALVSIKERNVLSDIYIHIKPMLFYFAYILISGCILFFFEGYQLSTVFQFFEKILFITILLYIIREDRSVKYVSYIGVILATCVSLYVISSTSSIIGRVRLSATISENSLGLICLYGIVGLYFLKSKLINSYIRLFLNIIFVITIILTASRQTLLLLILVYLFQFHKVKNSFFSGGKLRIKTASIIFFFVAIAVFIYLYRQGVFSSFRETTLFSRLMGTSRSTEVSDDTRIDLYLVGLKDFINSPLLGRGFNNCTRYTHSTYMEVLGGTGLIGTFIFYLPFIMLINRIKRKLKYYKLSEDENIHEFYFDRLMLVVLIIILMLFRAVHYYFIPMIFIAFMISGDFIETKNELERKER